MAEKLEVSRPSVREAYCVLEIVGILESKVGSGTYVKSGDIDQISINKIRDISTQEESPYEILEVRKIIEQIFFAETQIKKACEDHVAAHTGKTIEVAYLHPTHPSLSL